MKLKAIMIENRNIPLLPIVDRHMKFLPIGTEVEVITTLPIVNMHDYNKALTDPRFWAEYTNYDRVLIFQHDSGLLREGIEEFFEWDYIGARWSFPPYVGNGGLSLRNPKLMANICIDHPYKGMAIHGNEDVYFTNIMTNSNEYGRIATQEAAERFSVETMYKLGSMGYHAIHKYLSPLQCNNILNQYK